MRLPLRRLRHRIACCTSGDLHCTESSSGATAVQGKMRESCGAYSQRREAQAVCSEHKTLLRVLFCGGKTNLALAVIFPSFRSREYSSSWPAAYSSRKSLLSTMAPTEALVVFHCGRSLKELRGRGEFKAVNCKPPVDVAGATFCADEADGLLITTPAVRYLRYYF